MRDYYKILGLKATASPEDIHSRWIELMRKFHPDRRRKRGAQDERIKEINEAYEVLKHSSARAHYDLQRTYYQKKRTLHFQRFILPPTILLVLLFLGLIYFQTPNVISWPESTVASVRRRISITTTLPAPTTLNDLNDPNDTNDLNDITDAKGLTQSPIASRPSPVIHSPLPIAKLDPNVPNVPNELNVLNDVNDINGLNGLNDLNPSNSSNPTNPINATNEIDEINQPNPRNQTNPTRRVEVKKSRNMRKTPPSQINQIDETNQTNEIDEIDESNQTNPTSVSKDRNAPPRFAKATKPLKVQKAAPSPNQFNEINQINQKDETNQIDEINESNQTNQINEPKFVTALDVPNESNDPNVPNDITDAKDDRQLPIAHSPLPIAKLDPNAPNVPNELNVLNDPNDPNELNHLSQLTPSSLIASEEEVKHFFALYRGRYNRKDIDAFLSLFSSRAVQNQRDGFDEIKKIYSDFFDQSKELRYHIKDMRIEIFQNAVEIRAHYEIDQIGKRGGGKKVWKGEIRWILVEEDRALKIRFLDYKPYESP